jgi:hypothetical protein
MHAPLSHELLRRHAIGSGRALVTGSSMVIDAVWRTQFLRSTDFVSGYRRIRPV